jgi:hypothetical protein
MRSRFPLRDVYEPNTAMQILFDFSPPPYSTGMKQIHLWLLWALIEANLEDVLIEHGPFALAPDVGTERCAA